MSAINSLGATGGVQQAGHKHHHKKAAANAPQAATPALAQQAAPATSKSLDKTV